MKPKYRYNIETKEWDVVLSPYNYGRLIQELEMLRQIVSKQVQQPLVQPVPPRPLGPYECPNPYESPFRYGGLAPVVTNIPQSFC